MSDDLYYLPATEALRLFKAKKLSPLELMRAVIERAELVNSKINAFADTYFEEALAQATKAEAKYMRSDGRPRRLEGLPMAVKDETRIKGKRTTGGSLIFKDKVDDVTDVTVARPMRAGAIVHARTTTPEFCIATVTHSRIWGVTRSPWNLELTPGGSSGGSGAALAAGTATLANGTDIGGSIRIPASACGVVGFKPPYGRNPEMPLFNLDFYSHSGPMARTVADCALLQNVMVGAHPSDIASLKPKLTLPNSFKAIKGWRIAYSLDLGYFQVDPEVRKNTLAAVEVFRDLGATVEEVELGWGSDVEAAALAHLNHGAGTVIAEFLADHRDVMTDYAVKVAEAAGTATPADYVEALKVAVAMYDVFGPLMERYRVFLCPTLAVPAVAADHDPTDPEFAINGVPVGAALGWCMTYPFNILSRCPVLSVPSGRAASGVPTGLQIVGRTYDDVSVFQAAAAFEAAAPWLDEAARRPDL